MAADPTSTPKRPAYLVFEGGGARGVAHVGALQAVEDSGYRIDGVAGTSAGALVAVLVALGFEAEDIIDPEDPYKNIITTLGQTPTGLLNERDWEQFQHLRNRGAWAFLMAALWGGVVNLATAPRVMGMIWRLIERSGHFSTVGIEAFVDTVIRKRLKDINEIAGLGREIPDRVTFAELANDWPTVIPLKIVATDVESGTLEIFTALRTPDVVVAEAVAASIAIPLVFRPAAIPSYRAGRFADGGLVSNLPIWSFTEEKLCLERERPGEPPIPMIGFTLEPPKETARRQNTVSAFAQYATKLVTAALQGSQNATVQFLDDVQLIRLECALKTLDFAADRNAYAAAREAGRKSAAEQLRFSLETKPERIRDELETVRAAALQSINEKRAELGEKPVTHVRVNLIRPFGARSLRVFESVGMDGDADDRLVIDRRGSGAARAFRRKNIVIANFRGAGWDSHMTKYERALIRARLHSAICVPIFAETGSWELEADVRPEPSGILVVDSDDNLEDVFADETLQDMLVVQSAEIYTATMMKVDDGPQH
ncbi:MAG: patatin-like phospholipase family protein [Sphingomonadaceae bacterium]